MLCTELSHTSIIYLTFLSCVLYFYSCSGICCSHTYEVWALLLDNSTYFKGCIHTERNVIYDNECTTLRYSRYRARLHGRGATQRVVPCQCVTMHCSDWRCMVCANLNTAWMYMCPEDSDSNERILDNSVLLSTCSSVAKSRCFTVPANFSGTAFRTQAKTNCPL